MGVGWSFVGVGSIVDGSRMVDSDSGSVGPAHPRTGAGDEDRRAHLDLRWVILAGQRLFVQRVLRLWAGHRGDAKPGDNLRGSWSQNQNRIQPVVARCIFHIYRLDGYRWNSSCAWDEDGRRGMGVVRGEGMLMPRGRSSLFY